MEIAITLVTAPGSQYQLLEAAAAFQRELSGALTFRWLGEGEAVDLIWDAGASQSSSAETDEEARPAEEMASLRRFAQGVIGSRAIDVCVQTTATRRKRMLIADMDSTIIGQECLDEMAELKGIKPEIAALTERAMRGELDFETALRERIRLLRGLTESDLHQVLKERISLNPGARTLVQTMRARGAHTVLVSGGFTFFTDAIARRAGFAGHRANIFEWDDGGHLSGVRDPILGREAKLAALEAEAASKGVSVHDAVAIGDGANDLAMLKAAGLGIAYRAKPVVAAEADAQVMYADLTAVLYFQGYSRQEFIQS